MENLLVRGYNGLNSSLSYKYNLYDDDSILKLIHDYNLGIIKDFNVFDFDDEFVGDISFINLFSRKHFGIPRFGKSLQYLILQKLDFKTPRTFVDNNINISNDNIRSLPYTIIDKDIDEVIIKANNGARGVGQLLINKVDIYDFFECKNKHNKFDYSKCLIGGHKDDPDRISFLEQQLSNGNFFFQEKIDILKEYRVIVFYNGNVEVVQRNGFEYSPKDLNPIKEGDPVYLTQDVGLVKTPYTIGEEIIENIDTTFQNNVSVTNSGEYIKHSTDEIMRVKNFAIKFTKELSRLTQKDIPFLSIDIYEDNTGQLGIFEFQQQFAFKMFPKQMIVDNMLESIDNCITQK